MENYIVEFSEKNIFLKFSFENQLYAVVSKNVDLEEDSEIYLVKVDLLDGDKILRNIESDEEYSRVEKEYDRILNECDMEDEEDV